MTVDPRLAAYAYLSRVVEPGSPLVWDFLAGLDAEEAADRIRTRHAPPVVLAATESRFDTAVPERDLDAAAAVGARLVTPESPEWPHFALGSLEVAARRRAMGFRADSTPRIGGEQLAPFSLWIKGPDELRQAAAAPSVAVVGSRASTAYGEHVATHLGHDLAEHDVTVVSGGAFGIDAAAHRGALSARGRTWLVSAAGVDRPYPTRNRVLFERAVVDGLVISEYPPGSAPHRHRFVMRNRLIAAFATATVVVEAALRSGALNTGTHAADLGRTVMAVPGPVTSTMSAGCHQLLRQETDPSTRAVLVTGARDVLAHLRGEVAVGAAGEVDRVRSALDGLDPRSRQVFEGVPARGYATEEQVARRSGIPVLQVIQALPLLKLAGLVESSVEGHRVASAVRTARRPGTDGAT